MDDVVGQHAQPGLFEIRHRRQMRGQQQKRNQRQRFVALEQPRQFAPGNGRNLIIANDHRGRIRRHRRDRVLGAGADFDRVTLPDQQRRHVRGQRGVFRDQQYSLVHRAVFFLPLVGWLPPPKRLPFVIISKTRRQTPPAMRLDAARAISVDFRPL